MEANRRAFIATALRPRVLRDVSNIDLKVPFLGSDLPMPLIIAPMGAMSQYHADGEAEMAAGVYDANALMCVSTHTRISLGDIRKQSPNARLVWQIYFYGDRDWVKQQIDEAIKYNCEAICICVDAPSRPVRYLDRETRYDARKVGRQTSVPAPDTSKNSHLTWDDFDWLRSIVTDVPLWIKGIMTAEDAVLSLDHGADLIWISNHGGRQLDSGLATLEVVEEIREAAGTETPIIMDGGVRTGSDIIKALALGADVIAIGRPAIYGLIAGGREGVQRVFELYREEIISSMAMCGLTQINEIDHSYVRTKW
jgi:isopentenyl diphosphate isomerase/L-lactate dehydrogenase-like FMN-dependent dehydrogenase